MGRTLHRYLQPRQLSLFTSLTRPGATDPLMTSFNESLPYDRALHTADILGSKAYARAIAKSNIITADECSEIQHGLDLVEQEWLTGTFQAQPNDEDIHTANERRLGELIGTKIAGKLHTGRSRNDQVATDMRIWLREEGRKLVGILKELISVLISRGEKEIDVLMPGYTHLQVQSLGRVHG
jgi:argininosuccinate lyase